MAYFAALFAFDGQDWQGSDVDLDDVGDLVGLADAMRGSAYDEQPVLLFLEQEDTWFAVVRVDSEDDPRVFVSDASAAGRSAYGGMLVAELTEENDDIDLDAFDAEDIYENEDAVAVEEDEEAEAEEAISGPVGDPDLLSDWDMRSSELLTMCGEGVLPNEALALIADRVGFAETLESIR